jgi:DnaJ-domain-containing protein 1
MIWFYGISLPLLFFLSPFSLLIAIGAYCLAYYLGLYTEPDIRLVQVYLICGYAWVAAKWAYRHWESSESQEATIGLSITPESISEHPGAKRAGEPTENYQELRSRVVGALVNVGYSHADAERALTAAASSYLGPLSFDVLFREALGAMLNLPAEFASFEECLQSGRVDIDEKFEYALKELAAPINTVLKKRYAELDAPDCLLGEILLIIAYLAESYGGVTEVARRFFLDIARKLRPMKFMGLRAPDAADLLANSVPTNFRVESVTFAVRALRTYDQLHNTTEASKLASLYILMISEFTHLHVQSLPGDAAATALSATFAQFIGDQRLQPSQDTRELYELLGLQPGCTETELKSAYRQKVSQWHPDRLEHMALELRQFATEQLAKINAAYEKLTRVSSADSQE